METFFPSFFVFIFFGIENTRTCIFRKAEQMFGARKFAFFFFLFSSLGTAPFVCISERRSITLRVPKRCSFLLEQANPPRHYFHCRFLNRVVCLVNRAFPPSYYFYKESGMLTYLRFK